MTAPFTITLDEIVALGPCQPRMGAALAMLPREGEITAQSARDAGCEMLDLVWAMTLVARRDPAVERAIRHWLADCAEHVLPIYEAAFPADHRPRMAIDAARDIADGDPTAADAVVQVTRKAASQAISKGKRGAGSAAFAAAMCVGWSAQSATRTAWACSDAAGARRWADGRDAWLAEQAWQYDALVARLSGNLPA